MRRRSYIVVALMLLAACRSQPSGDSALRDDLVQQPAPPSTLPSAPEAITPTVALEAFRSHCKACHAIGDLKFLSNETEDTLWERLFTDKVPGKERLWATAIVRVLAWPPGPPPAQTAELESGVRWMPLGSSRIKLAQSTIGGVATREALLARLKHELTTRGLPTE